VKDLTRAEMEALGRWFETRPTHAHAVADPQLANRGRELFEQGNGGSGVPACASCHGNNAQGSAELPRLAGQHAQYTERQLKQFSQRERTNDNAVMHLVASRLSEAEMKAVASYVSGLR
jgi:cytochrome c553